MDTDPWEPPETEVGGRFDAATSTALVERLADGHCDDLWIDAVSRLDVLYEVSFTRVGAGRAEQFDCLAWETDDGWAVSERTRTGIATVTSRAAGGRLHSPDHLEDPLDLTDDAFQRLVRALEDNCKKFRTARESVHGAVYYLGRLAPDRYEVLFLARHPMKPGWTHELRTEATHDPETGRWTVPSVEQLDRYNWM